MVTHILRGGVHAPGNLRGPRAIPRAAAAAEASDSFQASDALADTLKSMESAGWEFRTLVNVKGKPVYRAASLEQARSYAQGNPESFGIECTDLEGGEYRVDQPEQLLSLGFFHGHTPIEQLESPELAGLLVECAGLGLEVAPPCNSGRGGNWGAYLALQESGEGYVSYRGQPLQYLRGDGVNKLQTIVESSRKNPAEEAAVASGDLANLSRPGLARSLKNLSQAGWTFELGNSGPLDLWTAYRHFRDQEDGLGQTATRGRICPPEGSDLSCAAINHFAQVEAIDYFKVTGDPSVLPDPELGKAISQAVSRGLTVQGGPTDAYLELLEGKDKTLSLGTLTLVKADRESFQEALAQAEGMLEERDHFGDAGSVTHPETAQALHKLADAGWTFTSRGVLETDAWGAYHLLESSDDYVTLKNPEGQAYSFRGSQDFQLLAALDALYGTGSNEHLSERMTQVVEPVRRAAATAARFTSPVDRSSLTAWETCARLYRGDPVEVWVAGSDFPEVASPLQLTAALDSVKEFVTALERDLGPAFESGLLDRAIIGGQAGPLGKSIPNTTQQEQHQALIDLAQAIEVSSDKDLTARTWAASGAFGYIASRSGGQFLSNVALLSRMGAKMGLSSPLMTYVLETVPKQSLFPQAGQERLEVFSRAAELMGSFEPAAELTELVLSGPPEETVPERLESLERVARTAGDVESEVLLSWARTVLNERPGEPFLKLVHALAPAGKADQVAGTYDQIRQGMRYGHYLGSLEEVVDRYLTNLSLENSTRALELLREEATPQGGISRDGETVKVGSVILKVRS